MCATKTSKIRTFVLGLGTFWSLVLGQALSKVGLIQREIVHPIKMFTSALGTVQEKKRSFPYVRSAFTTACTVFLSVSYLRNRNVVCVFDTAAVCHVKWALPIFDTCYRSTRTQFVRLLAQEQNLFRCTSYLCPISSGKAPFHFPYSPFLHVWML